MSDPLQPHELHHNRLPWPSRTPGACSNSCPSSQWCHPTISSSVVPFSSCLQSFSASGSFPESQFFSSGDQSIGASASASVLSMNYSGLISFKIDWFHLLAVQGTFRSPPTPQFESISSLAFSFFYGLTHPYMTTGKTIDLTIWTFVGKVMSRFFSTISC